MSEAKKVKCSECGFLYLTDVHQGYQIEAEERFRVSGNQWDSDRIPRCFVRAHDLHSVLEKAKSRSDEDALAIINKERECDSFYPWKNGFTAKEHAHMIERDNDRKWQEHVLKINSRYTLISAGIGFAAAIVAIFISKYLGVNFP